MSTSPVSVRRPSMKSLPPPPSVRSLSSAAWSVSLPPPPFTLSWPKPVTIRSSPGPPQTRSLPLPVPMKSLPPRPTTTSFRGPVVRWSLPRVPTTVAGLPKHLGVDFAPCARTPVRSQAPIATAKAMESGRSGRRVAVMAEAYVTIER